MPLAHAAPLRKAGFTLIEMSIVLAIVAMITVGAISMGSSMIGSAQLASTRGKLDAIETALSAYRLVNNRLPCPGDATLTDIPANSATYGYEASVAGGCNAGTINANTFATLPSPLANTLLAGGSTIAEGAVPVRTLGLPDEYQFDGWGRKFAYAVWTPITAKGTSTIIKAGFLTYGISPSCGGITVESAAHSNRSQTAIYALVSYGPDGHGGYTKSGSRYNVGASMTNVDEIANAHYSNAGADTGYNATYVEKDYSNYASDSDANHPFGHIVRFKERWQMQNAFDTYHPNGAPCAPGFVINNTIASETLGIIGSGDINGDGIPDLIMGVGTSVSPHTIYVVFGTRSGFPDPLPLNTLNGTNGFKITGGLGITGSVADFNGDGYQDLITCIYGNQLCYIIYGGATKKDGTAWQSTQTMASLMNGVDGFEIVASSPSISEFGIVTATGDFNGDGIADLVVGAYGLTTVGSVFVIYGGPTKKDGTAWPNASPWVQAGALMNGTNGFELDGTVSSKWWGASVALGDINGDGYNDLVIAYPHYTVASQYGAVDVIFGGKTMMDGTHWPTDQAMATSGLGATLNGINGFELRGSAANGGLGNNVAVGDINGDGYADIFAGNGNGASDPNALIFGGKLGPQGGSALWTSTPITVNAAFLNGVNGLGFTVPSQGGVNTYVALGDVNCDGYADMFIGDFGPNSDAGSVFVIFGGKSGPQGGGSWSSSYYALPNSTFLNGVNGSEFDGPVANAFMDYGFAGDINGDGCADLIMGAPRNSPGGVSQAGSVYVYFGKASGWPTSAYNVGGL
jgi:prepilin-type N-terminal cleavage/methylation domain-containing protein